MLTRCEETLLYVHTYSLGLAESWHVVEVVLTVGQWNHTIRLLVHLKLDGSTHHHGGKEGFYLGSFLLQPSTSIIILLHIGLSLLGERNDELVITFSLNC